MIKYSVLTDIVALPPKSVGGGILSDLDAIDMTGCCMPMSTDQKGG